MSRRRWNGSYQSSNTPTYNKPGISRNDYALYRCMITKVIYVDDPSNISKNSQNPEVLYDAVILGGQEEGNTLSNCRLASWLGGNSNYSETILVPTSKDLSNVRLSQHDGDVVYIEFNQGHDGYPVIISMAKGLSNKVAATRADGPRVLEEYNGLIRNINNKGELITTMKSGQTKDGRFVSENSFLVKEEWLSTEKVDLSFRNGLKISHDGKNDVSTTTYKNGLSLIQNGKDDKTTVVFKGGLSVTTNGKDDVYTLVTKEGASIKIDGKNDVIQLKDKGTGALKITGEKVAIGASSAELLEQISQSLQQIITFANSEANHVHLGNLGYPTAVPTTTANWTALGSALTAIKGLVDGIKGTL